MTKEEKIKLLEAKAEELISWFKNRELPSDPFHMNNYSVVLDAHKYIATNVERIRSNAGNPYHRLYVTSYYNLFELKSYLEIKK